MKISKIFFSVLVTAFLLVVGANASKADEGPSPININFQVEAQDGSIYNQAIDVSACATPNNENLTVNGYCAFEAAGLTTDITWMSFGGLVNSINGVFGDSSDFWLWFLNDEPALVGIDSYILNPGDKILWALGKQPLKVTLSTTTPKVNEVNTITVLGFNPNSFMFEPVSGANIVGTTLTTNIEGVAEIVATSTSAFTISVSAEGYISSQDFTITPKPENIKVVIRNNSGTAFSSDIDLPEINSPEIFVTPDSGTTSPIAISPLSVLGILKNLETTTNEFKITNLAYFSSFNSFLINCVAIPASSSTPDCYNWTYAVNNSFPQVGIDQAVVKDGDTIYFFFGSSHKTTLSKTSVETNETFTAKAEQYDLNSGNYIPLTGVTLGIGNFQPDFSFLETATSTVDSNGQAQFTLNSEGSYEIGIKEDSYFPTTSLTVTKAQTSPPSSGGGGGGSAAQTAFNIPKAINFISQSQNTDGSFNSELVTDWTAIALASADSTEAKTKLKNYLANYNYAAQSITDYERHAMALLSLGLNPYNQTPKDYITPIVNAFDGTQIGDTGLETDDIFAIFPLSHAGYNYSDPIIQKTIVHIISKQKPNGSWNDSADVTAAAVMAIGPYFRAPGYVAATGKAFGYLDATQNPNGGWGNIDSTSWVLTMLNAIKESDPAHFIPITSSSGLKPEDYIFKEQNADGGVSSANRVWSTSYAVTAMSGKSWLSVLSSFPKPSTGGGANFGAGAVLGTSTTSTSTLTTLPPTTSTTSTSSLITIIPLPVDASTTPEALTTQNILSKPTATPRPKAAKAKTPTKVKITAADPTPTPTITPSTEENKNTETAVEKKPSWILRAFRAIGSFFGKLF